MFDMQPSLSAHTLSMLALPFLLKRFFGMRNTLGWNLPHELDQHIQIWTGIGLFKIWIKLVNSL